MSCTALLTGSTEVRRQQMDATRGTEFVGLFKERIISWAMVALPTLSLQHTVRRQRLAVIPLQESCVWGRRPGWEKPGVRVLRHCYNEVPVQCHTVPVLLIDRAVQYVLLLYYCTVLLPATIIISQV